MKEKRKEVLIKKLKIISVKASMIIVLLFIFSSFHKLEGYSLAMGIVIGYAIEQTEDLMEKYLNKEI